MDVVIAQSLPNGQTFKSFASTVELEFTDPQHDTMLREGFSFDRVVPLRPTAIASTSSSATSKRRHRIDRHPQRAVR